MVIAPNLADPDIERVRKLRLERLRQLRDHAPAVAERALVRVLYRDHPYGHLGLGHRSRARRRRRAGELRAFHARRVRARAVRRSSSPATPTVDELFAAAEDAFGGWETPRRCAAGQSPCRAGAAAARARASPRHRPAAGAAQSELRIGHVCASRDTPDYHALVLLNMILGGQFVSRVNLNLRQDKGYTYGVRTGFDLRRGLGPFVLQTSVQTEVTADAIREALRELEDMRGARPATADETGAGARVDHARLSARLRDRAAGRARRRRSWRCTACPTRYFEEFVPRVEAVTRGRRQPRRGAVSRSRAHGHARRRRSRPRRADARRRSTWASRWCLSASMKAVRFHEHGAPEVLRYEDAPDPEPQAGDVLVRVRACALNHLDLWNRRGVERVQFPLPHISAPTSPARSSSRPTTA